MVLVAPSSFSLGERCDLGINIWRSQFIKGFSSLRFTRILSYPPRSAALTHIHADPPSFVVTLDSRSPDPAAHVDRILSLSRVSCLPRASDGLLVLESVGDSEFSHLFVFLFKLCLVGCHFVRRFQDFVFEDRGLGILFVRSSSFLATSSSHIQLHCNMLSEFTSTTSKSRLRS